MDKKIVFSNLFLKQLDVDSNTKVIDITLCPKELSPWNHLTP